MHPREKEKQRAAFQAQRAELLNRNPLTKFGGKYRVAQLASEETGAPAQTSPARQGSTEAATIVSLVTRGGEAAAKPQLRYTGDRVLGVVVLHKSCLQPVFNQEAAIDAARMRR